MWKQMHLFGPLGHRWRWRNNGLVARRRESRAAPVPEIRLVRGMNLRRRLVTARRDACPGSSLTLTYTKN